MSIESVLGSVLRPILGKSSDNVRADIRHAYFRMHIDAILGVSKLGCHG